MLRFITLFLLFISFAGFAAQPNCRCKPGEACWPTTKDWSMLAKQLKGQLVKPTSALAICKVIDKSHQCINAKKAMHNPFYMQSQPGYTESQGWLNAWQSHPSTYAIEAVNNADVVAGVNFARQHNLRLVIKGAGHDYLGRNNAPNSLLIWTHKMDALHYDKSFVPMGAPKGTPGVEALTAGAGARWIQAYTLVTTQHHRYVQGGGCTTVGVAGGFMQGGGLGSWSKKYGLAAASILQAKVVTADGKTVIANPYQNKDLFWALRGGGGGTFGVVTQITLKTYPLPSTFGLVQGIIKAKSNIAYKQLIGKFLVFFRDHLNNQHWGEQIGFGPDNTIKIGMVYQGLTKSQVEKIWKPMHADLTILAIPPTKMWDLAFWKHHKPDMVMPNFMQGSAPGQYWWSPDGDQVSMYWYAYSSWWLPERLFKSYFIKKTVNAFYKASRIRPFALHIQKGLAGGSNLALSSEKTTSINPSLYHSATLVLMASGTNKIFVGENGQKLNHKKAIEERDKVRRAMHYFEKLAPHAGSYANEGDYFQANWQQVFWSANYPRLLSIKTHYDPMGLFYCHHCVGSELWKAGGFCRR